MADEQRTESDISTAERNADPALLETMARAGILYGRKKSRTNPKMRAYIFTTRSGIEIIDLPKTLEAIERAEAFLASIVQGGGKLLFVGTAPAAKEFVKVTAEKLGYPAVIERWLGGTLTNFKTLSTRIQYFLKLKADRDAGRLEKYTKKERTQFDKEIRRLTQLFGGLEKLTELPQALVVLGATRHDIAIREAKRMHIPVVAIMNTDANPDHAAYPIPANDNAKSSLMWILERLEQAIARGLAARQAQAAKTGSEGPVTGK